MLTSLGKKTVFPGMYSALCALRPTFNGHHVKIVCTCEQFGKPSSVYSARPENVKQSLMASFLQRSLIDTTTLWARPPAACRYYGNK